MSDPLIEAARQLQTRDQAIADAIEDGTFNKDDYPDSDDIWSGVAHFPKRQTKAPFPSHTARGPYPRHRRVLADLAISADWTREQTKEFENKIVTRMAMAASKLQGRKEIDISDPENPTIRGQPYTIEHIAWENLRRLIIADIDAFDSEKSAIVKEHVLQAYPSNSKEPKKLPQAAGAKRKSTVDPGAALSTVDFDDLEVPSHVPMDSCNVVRGKINRYLEAGEMKVGEFCDAIGVSGNAYRRFMAQNGKDKGAGSDTYVNAWEFFKKRELLGVKEPKKQKTAVAAAASKTSQDISNVRLEGEDNDAVEVYDSCDEIRRKISAHLRKPGVTQAQFCRDLLAQYHADKKPSQIQSAQLTRFRGYKGADTGNTSCVFYAAYVFFEKLRISENKPKSKHRLEMETIWGAKGGFNVTRGHHRGYYCVGDEKPFQDQFGRVSFH